MVPNNTSFSEKSYTTENLLKILANYIIKLDFTRAQLEKLIGAVMGTNAVKKEEGGEEESLDQGEDWGEEWSKM